MTEDRGAPSCGVWGVDMSAERSVVTGDREIRSA